MNGITEREIANEIRAAIEDGDEPDLMIRMEIRSVRDFYEAGILTADEGFEITMADGSAFQVTVKRSR